MSNDARWRDEHGLPPILRDALQVGRQADDEDARRLSRLHARLAPALGWPEALGAPGDAGASAPSASGPSVSSVPASPLSAPGVSSSIAPAAVGTSGAATAGLAAVAVLKVTLVVATVAAGGAFGWLASRPAAQVAPHAPTVAQAPQVTPGNQAAPLPPTNEATSPPAAPTPVDVVVPVVVPQARSTTPPRATQAVATVGHKPRAQAPTLQGEARLLQLARSALSDDPAQALALAQQHARRFHFGLLSQERDAIVIEALTRLERTAEAHARLRRFKTAYPGSPHTRGLAERLAGD